MLHLLKARFLVSLAGFVVLVLFLCGCGDNPEDKASKRLGRSVQKAEIAAGRISLYDVAALKKIRKELASAIREEAGDAEGGAEPAYFAAGNLAFAQGQYLLSHIDDLEDGITGILSELTRVSHELGYLQMDKDRLVSAMNTAELELAQYMAILEGDGGSVGVLGQLDDAESKFAALRSEKEGLEVELAQAMNIKAATERLAESKFREAEMLSGEEKVRLEGEGYRILLNKDVVSIHELLDSIATVESRIAIVAPLVKKLRGDAGKLERKVSKLQSATRVNQLRAELQEVEGRMAGHQKTISKLTDDLGGNQETYNSQAGEIVGLFKDAMTYYKKLRSSKVRAMGNVRRADSYFWMGSVFAKRMKFEQQVEGRLESVERLVGGRIGRALADKAGEYAESSSASGAKAMENYDEALALYEKSGGRGGGACEAVKSKALTLYAKMALAERLGDEAGANEFFDAFEVVMQEAVECDSDFSDSATVRLAMGGEGYVPSIPVDMTTYYEVIKGQFAKWSKIRDMSERESEVNRLLAIFADMGEPKDADEFDRILGPERNALEAALAKGFEEKEMDEDLTYDPNMF